MTGERPRLVSEHPPLVCVMGVSASGKSTVGIALAEALGVRFLDADSLHSDANRSKMNAGTPLNDDDRWPWLDAVGARFGEAAETGLVLACSALKRAYRDRIRAGAPDVLFVHLHGSRTCCASGSATGQGISCRRHCSSHSSRPWRRSIPTKRVSS